MPSSDIGLSCRLGVGRVPRNGRSLPNPGPGRPGACRERVSRPERACGPSPEPGRAFERRDVLQECDASVVVVATSVRFRVASLARRWLESPCARMRPACDATSPAFSSRFNVKSECRPRLASSGGPMIPHASSRTTSSAPSRRSPLLLLTLLVSLQFVPPALADGTWQQTEFMIGAYSDAPLIVGDRALTNRYMKIQKDCGFNLLVGG